MGRVEGKAVVITGAARGQGRSHAVRLAEEGADIIAIDLCEDIPVAEYPMATPEDLEETARLVEKTGSRVVARKADVRDPAALRAAVDEGVAELGKLDVVIANAGISPLGAGRPITAFTDTVDINLSGALNTVHAALPHMTAGGSVIMVGSAVGLIPGHGDPGPMGPGGAGYSVAKQTLVLYTHFLSLQLAPLSIRINCVHPSNVNTDMIQNDAVYRIFRPDLEAPTRQDGEMGLYAFHALPVPYLEPEDVSHVMTYLASDESRYMTGSQIKVDCGALVKRGF